MDDVLFDVFHLFQILVYAYVVCHWSLCLLWFVYGDCEMACCQLLVLGRRTVISTSMSVSPLKGRKLAAIVAVDRAFSGTSLSTVQLNLSRWAL